MTPNFRNLQPLLAPRGIAVVGASPRGNRGSRVLANLERFAYKGEVVVVNPSYDVVLGRRCVPDVSRLPDGIDLVVVAVGAGRALDVVRDAGERGCRGLVVIGSGFGEGENGVDRAEALVQLIEKYDMVACGPNCYGVLDLGSGTAAYSGRILESLPAGNVALVLQSGALTHAVTDSAIGRGLAVSAIVTTGNEVSATVSDYVAWYAEDETTKVIGVFVEGLRDAPKFAEACRHARARGKAVVMLASGRSEIGRRAAMAHTGAISGGTAALDGLLATAGVIRVDDLDELRETLLLFSALASHTPTAPGVAALSISGGACGLTADMAASIGVDLPSFGEPAKAALATVLPDFAAINNPLDVTGAAAENPEILAAALKCAAEDPRIGLVLFAMNVGLAGPGQQDFYRGQAAILARQAAETSKPILLLPLTSGALDHEIGAITQRAGIPVVMGLRPAMKAVRSWLDWPGLKPAPRPQVREAADWPSSYPVAAGSDALDALVAAGIPVARYGLASTAAEVGELVRTLGERVVLKIESPDIAHKTEVGGVRLGVTAETAAAEAERLLAGVAASVPDARVDGILVQQMMSGDYLECLVGVVADPQVGLCMSIAPGGVMAELMGKAAARPVPLTQQDAEDLIDAGVLGVLLDGFRDGPVFDRAALVDTAVQFSHLAASVAGLAAAEMNPLLVAEVGLGVVAVDCLLVRDDRTN
jgi:acetate---CoA ligase (ADP-forming)